MKRKLLISLLAIASAASLTFGLVACKDAGSSGGNGGSNNGGNGGGGGNEYEVPEEDGDTLLAYKIEEEIKKDEEGNDVLDENDDPVMVNYAVVTGIGQETETDIRIPATIGGFPVKSVADEAFNGATYLTGVSFAEGVSEIGQGAFAGCTGLRNVTLPNSLKKVGSGVFQNCTSITGVRIGEGLTAISNAMFHSCKKLTKITIPENITSIGDSAFFGSGLINIDLGTGVESLGPRALSQCKSIVNLDLTEATGLKTIGNNCFEANDAMVRFILPNSVEFIGESVLVGCSSIDFISVPFFGAQRYDGPKTEGEPPAVPTHFSYLFGAHDADDNNRVLGDIKGKSITVRVTDARDDAPICYGAFHNTIGIGTVIVEGTIQTLWQGAFAGNSIGTFVNYVLPESITRIEAGAFMFGDIGTIYFGGNNLRWSTMDIAGDNANIGTATLYCFGEWDYDENGYPKAN